MLAIFDKHRSVWLRWQHCDFDSSFDNAILNLQPSSSKINLNHRQQILHQPSSAIINHQTHYSSSPCLSILNQSQPDRGSPHTTRSRRLTVSVYTAEWPRSILVGEIHHCNWDIQQPYWSAAVDQSTRDQARLSTVDRMTIFLIWL